jgi:cysteinyl-tRNA synthetase
MAAVVLRLYDTRTQALTELRPLVPGRVGMYVCGPTVQSSPHIGHLRSALSYDLLRRWLEHRGLSVTLIRNVTDIDDKILAASRGQDPTSAALAASSVEGSAGEPWWALAYRVELEFTAAYRAIGVLPPTYEPRATANVDRMQALIARLIDRGHAYPAPDGSGDVYFSVQSWPSYGELTRQRPEDMASGEEADPRARRDPRDFALWKGRKPDEPESASWPSPWGPGRPGWHIECSAMAERYLGTTFDIHGGGLDLRFPHHENELAQSGAAGHPFARAWVHNGLVTVAGQKMSKSLGNSVFAADLLGTARPIVVRYALGSAHYRSTLDHHDGALLEAEEAVSRIERFLERAERALEGTRFAASSALALVPDAFAAAMDDDLGVPEALAVLHDTIRGGNQALDVGDHDGAARALHAVRAMVGVLGLDPAAREWRSSDERGPAAEAPGALVDRLVADRDSARAARDWVTADRLRDLLAASGVTLEDGAAGTRWTVGTGDAHGR